VSGAEIERRLELFGTEVRILIGPPSGSGGPGTRAAAAVVEQLLRRQHGLLTRFDPASELCRLNADPREVVPVSGILAGALRAALDAAELTDGLVDPTLLGELERAGYAGSRRGMEPADMRAALRSAPWRRPARPHPRARWRAIEVHEESVRRPPGLRLDLGGSAKGYAADSAAALLAGYPSYAIDVGGDIAVGGTAGAPRIAAVEDPLGRRDLRFRLTRGAVATSGISRRLWSTADGFGHHLIDPATGRPAWTGVVQATAFADTTVRAEALAKAALLAGPEAGLCVLQPGGGALVLDDGSVRLAPRTTGERRTAA
jgi:FAD:protein FMN transferase